MFTMILYHYTSFKYAMKIISEQRFKFSNPSNFNDLFECRASIETEQEANDLLGLIKPRLEELAGKLFEMKHHNSARPELKQPFIDQFIDTNTGGPALLRQAASVLKKHELPLTESLAILCLSENQDNPLMWGHYADNHRGVAIGVDPLVAFPTEPPSEFPSGAQQVHYSTRRPSVTECRACQNHKFLTKSIDWRYEAEWRVVRAQTDADRNLTESEDRFFSAPPEAFHEIVFGQRATPSDISAFDALRQNRPDLKHLRLYWAQTDPFEYQMEIVDVDRLLGAGGDYYGNL